MSITTAMCSSFKQELFEAGHDFTSDTFKCALIKGSPAGTYGPATTNYSDVTGNSDEASGTGYTAGGATLANITLTLSGTFLVVDFDDVQWTSATFDAAGAVIYNTSLANAAVAVFDFGGTRSVSSGTFTFRLPEANAATALIGMS